jgi:hypothetical protein
MGSMVHGFEAAGAGNGEELRLMVAGEKKTAASAVPPEPRRPRR